VDDNVARRQFGRADLEIAADLQAGLRDAMHGLLQRVGDTASSHVPDALVADPSRSYMPRSLQSILKAVNAIQEK
jgi:hypothetical protein